MEKLKKILVLYTGGTIGMQTSPCGLIPNNRSVADFLSTQNFSTVDLLVCEPIIDSAAVNYHYWNQWLNIIRQSEAEYDGFVILHGTDTLGFTAAVLSLLLTAFSKPIVISGAMEPLSKSGTDAKNNIIQSIELIAAVTDGVYVVFNGQALSALNCTKITTDTRNAFITPYCALLGEYKNKMWNLKPTVPIDLAVNLANFSFNPELKILTVYITPNIDNYLGQLLDLNHWDAIILQTYGNGNLVLDSKIEQSLQKLTEQGKLILNVSQVLLAKVNNRYAVGWRLAELGVIAAKRLSFETVFAMLAILLSLTSTEMDLPTTATKWIDFIDKRISIINNGYS